MAVVLREPPLPDLEEQLRHCCGVPVSALTLALPGNDGTSAGSLVQVEILAAAPHAPPEQGVHGAGLAQSGALGRGTAAFDCFAAGRPLVWRASQGRQAVTRRVGPSPSVVKARLSWDHPQHAWCMRCFRPARLSLRTAY